MSKIPGNLKQLGIEKCPLCQQNEVSTEHYFECNRCVQIAEIWGVKKEDLKSHDIKKLKDVGNFIQKVETMLEPIIESKLERGRQITAAKKEKKTNINNVK